MIYLKNSAYAVVEADKSERYRSGQQTDRQNFFFCQQKTTFFVLKTLNLLDEAYPGYWRNLLYLKSSDYKY